jgi:hypothetical protein
MKNDYELCEDLGICLIKVQRKDDIKWSGIDIEDCSKVESYRWYLNQNGYAIAHMTMGPKQYKKVFLHHVIIGEVPEGIHVDHINGNKLDNRKENLRLATPTQNQGNSKIPKNNKTGYKGVFQVRSGKFVAQIKINYKSTHLGTFDTAEQAAEAYNKAASDYFGEFKRL